MRMMKKCYFILLFLNNCLPLYAAVCPTPVVDDVGISYHTKERFDMIRRDKNTLSTPYIHHRGNKQEQYKYIINFCGKDGSVAVEQRSKSGKSTTVGKISGASVLIGAENWLLIQYFDGKSYNQKHCGGKKRQGWISIRCEDKGEEPRLRVIEEARYLTGKQSKQSPLCYFLFEYNHPAACSARKSSLSGSAVFTIIVVVLASSYLLIGFLYKRFIVEAKGAEQIPNYHFWKTVGNTLADGCSFVCRREETSNTYKGMADALDIETSDEEDNTLLPM